MSRLFIRDESPITFEYEDGHVHKWRFRGAAMGFKPHLQCVLCQGAREPSHQESEILSNNADGTTLPYLYQGPNGTISYSNMDRYEYGKKKSKNPIFDTSPHV